METENKTNTVQGEPEETMEDYSRELEASFRTINQGDVLSGSVI